ncbi:MAG: hypothetical protein ACRES5_27540, partial [Pseudomonas sp.]
MLWLDFKGQPVGADGLLAALATELQIEQADLVCVQTCLAQTGTPTWVIIDDFPRTMDSALDRLLNTLVQSSSNCVHWWIASRRRPVGQWARLLLEGKLLELSACDLALTNDELLNVLRHDGRQYAPACAQQLLELTDGWYAGVQIQLHCQSGGGRFEGRRSDLFAQSLESAVLDGLVSGWRESLCALACFASFDEALCEQLFGTGEGGRLLRQLHEAGLFIEALDKRGMRFRVQPAIAALLAARVGREQKHQMFSQACQGFIAAHQPHQAIEYALLAGQYEVAVTVLQTLRLDHLLQGREMVRVLRWRQQLPARFFNDSPKALMLVAWALLLSGRLEEAQAWADRLQRSTSSCESLAQWQVLVAMIGCHLGEADTS